MVRVGEAMTYADRGGYGRRVTCPSCGNSFQALRDFQLSCTPCHDRDPRNPPRGLDPEEFRESLR